MGVTNINKKKPPVPNHVRGMDKGEETVIQKGREAGRRGANRRSYRTSRDSTGIDADSRAPVHPDSPSIPPA